MVLRKFCIQVHLIHKSNPRNSLLEFRNLLSHWFIKKYVLNTKECWDYNDELNIHSSLSPLPLQSIASSWDREHFHGLLWPITVQYYMGEALYSVWNNNKKTSKWTFKWLRDYSSEGAEKGILGYHSFN